MVHLVKKNPKDLDENSIDKTTLEFYFSRCNLIKILKKYQFSLEWLPLLIKNQNRDSAKILSNWVISSVKKPEDVLQVLNQQKVLDVNFANNVKFFIENHFSRDELLINCWQLVAQHLIDNPDKMQRNEWEELLKELNKGEITNENLDKLVDFIRPRVVIHEQSKERTEIKNTLDIFKVDFQSLSFVLTNEVMDILKRKLDIKSTIELLQKLTSCLSESLEVAKVAGEQRKNNIGTIDTQVRSIADHPLDIERQGYYKIVRLIADIWNT